MNACAYEVINAIFGIIAILGFIIFIASLGYLAGRVENIKRCKK